MAEVRVRIAGLTQLAAACTLTSRQFDKAVRSAVTFMAKDYTKEKTVKIPRDIDRPAPFSKRSYSWDGVARTGPIVSRAYVRPKQADYLLFMEEGLPKQVGLSRSGKKFGPISIGEKFQDKYGGAWGKKGIQKKFLAPTARKRAARRASGRPYRVGTVMYDNLKLTTRAAEIYGLWQKKKVRIGRKTRWVTNLAIKYLSRVRYREKLHFTDDGIAYGRVNMSRKINRAVMQAIRSNWR